MRQLRINRCVETVWKTLRGYPHCFYIYAHFFRVINISVIVYVGGEMVQYSYQPIMILHEIIQRALNLYVGKNLSDFKAFPPRDSFFMKIE